MFDGILLLTTTLPFLLLSFHRQEYAHHYVSFKLLVLTSLFDVACNKVLRFPIFTPVNNAVQ